MKKCFVTVFFVSVFSLSLSCGKPDALTSVRNGDFSLVHKDSYRGKLIFLADGREYLQTVDHLRVVIEKNMDIFDLISEKFYPIPHLGYRFKFAVLDSQNNSLVLRYFARIPEHPLYAGYQIQMVFDVGSRKLKKIYTSEVPLE
jgi:hypothetical protein